MSSCAETESCAEAKRRALVAAARACAAASPSRSSHVLSGQIVPRFAAMAAVAALALGGCYEHHLCPAEERCNLRDDDCDGLVDEDFVDEEGRYVHVAHCGACGTDCARAYPSFARVTCALDAGEPICVPLECPPGWHRADEGACAPDLPVLCLPCTSDDDCALRVPGARCRPTATGAGRCGQPCGAGMVDCPAGFACADGQCAPESGVCACGEDSEGVELACLLPSPDPSHRCAGARRCGPDGPTECLPVLDEGCNGQDDDCDGRVDEDFRDADGRYLARLHCGACASPCVEPGPNMRADCLPDGSGVRCEVACLEGFVDVDRILANGCECERWDGMGPPPIVGGDADCDGVADDTDDFVYVSVTGSDTNPGTLARPMRTLAAALARARDQGKDVLVSRGIYDGAVELVAGVSLFGGYAPDFRDRDLELYPVLLERTDVAGAPVLTCRGIDAPTRVEGFVVQGSDATREGTGSTAVWIEECGPAVQFAALTILAGRGADGVRGDDSSTNLRDWGLSSLAQLDGQPGSEGAPGNGGTMPCRRVEGGAGGMHTCRGLDVSGGRGGAAECPGDICTNGSPCANAGCTDFTVGGVCDFETVLRLAVPNPAASPGRGPRPGAAGERTYNAPTNRGACSFCDDNPTLLRDGDDGGDGAPGADGAGGIGCRAPPTVDTFGRLSGGAGTSGAPGGDGSGGGGGSAGGGYEVIGGTVGAGTDCSDRSGGSGGGGGSGGCGAPPADGGGGGGYSIGLLVRVGPDGTGPRFERSVRIVTASGGDGGDGGVGAAGGAGGTGASGGLGRFWCARSGGRGGDGGRGGAGGGGGGGCGGGSHGIYLVGASPSYRDMLAGVTIETAGVAGRGGRGGFSPGQPGTDGADGSADPIALAP